MVTDNTNETDAHFETLARNLLKDFTYALDCSLVRSYGINDRKDEYVSITMRRATPTYERGQIEAAVKYMDWRVPVRVGYSLGNGGA